MLLLEQEHHTFTQELIAMGGSLASGGIGFRYMRIAVQTMPAPIPGSRWYAWFYDFVQQAMDNYHLLPDQQRDYRPWPEPNGGGKSQKGGGPE